MLPRKEGEEEPEVNRESRGSVQQEALSLRSKTGLVLFDPPPPPQTKLRPAIVAAAAAATNPETGFFSSRPMIRFLGLSFWVKIQTL